jgi:phosphohistidine phosphatase
MKKLLTILRHGEAEFVEYNNGDFTRELSAKGREDIQIISNTIKQRKTSFDLLIKSPSKRTLQTAELLMEQIRFPQVQIEDSIYESSLENLIQVIRNIPVDISNALLIGHNPSLSALIGYLDQDNYINLQPGTMVRMEVYVGDWDHITQGSASVFEVLK